jgi:hypothetical protein
MIRKWLRLINSKLKSLRNMSNPPKTVVAMPNLDRDHNTRTAEQVKFTRREATIELLNLISRNKF